MGKLKGTLKNYYIFQIIKNLTKADNDAFERWLIMREILDLIPLFTAISKYDMALNEELNKSTLFALVYPQKKFNSSQFRLLLHRLLSEFKLFAAYQNLIKQPISIEDHWLKWLQSKDISKIYEKYFKKYLKQYKKGDTIVWDGSRNHYSILIGDLMHRILPNDEKGLEYAQFGSQVISQHFVAEILYSSITVNNLDSFYNKEVDFPIGDEMIKWIKNKSYFNSEVVEMLWLANQLAQKTIEESSKDFDRYCELLTKYHKDFDRELNFVLFTIRTNVIFRYANKKQNKTVFIEAFKIEKERHELGYAFLYDTLSQISYINVVYLGLSIGELKWAEKYVERFKKFVIEEVRENAYRINKAYILYFKKQHKKCLIELDKIDIDTNINFLHVKKLQLQNLYELKQFEHLKMFVNSSNRSFYRKIEARYYWPTSIKFFKFSKRLIDLTIEKNVEKTINLLADIKIETSLGNREWLITKTEILLDK